MATLAVTFTFLADAQSFVATPGSVATTMTWDGTVGNPLGSLKSILAGSARSDNNSWALTTTYEGLGVPPGSQITGITSGSLDSQCTAFASGTGCSSGAASLTDGPTIVVLSTQRSFSATDSVFVSTTGVNATGLSNPSSNSITFSILNHLGTTSGGSGKGVTLYQDNLRFTLTFVPAVIEGVFPLIAGRSEGRIARVGPMRPGMSRFWQPSTFKRQLILGPVPSTAYPFAADAGPFALAGMAAGLAIGHAVAGGALYTVTGTTTPLAAARKMVASAGSFVESGTDATLTVNRINALGGVVQPFHAIAIAVQSSQSVMPRPTWTSPGEIGRPGPSLPGLSRFHPAVSFRAGKTSAFYALAADSGTFTETGIDAALTKDINPAVGGVTRPIGDGSTATPVYSSKGAITRTGWTSRGEIGRPGPGLPGTSRLWKYQITAGRTGPHTSTLVYTLTADAGVFTETGTAASLVISRAVTGAALYAASGTAAALVAARQLTASAGAFTENGNAAALNRGHGLVTTLGNFFETGIDSGLAYGHQLTASVGSFVETSIDVGLIYSAGMVGGVRPRPGWTASGLIGRPGPNRPGLSRFWQSWKWQPLRAAIVTVDHPLTASAGSFVETGTAAALTAGRAITASAGTFLETGLAATLTADQARTALAGSFVETGIDAVLAESHPTAGGSVLPRPGWTSPGKIGKPAPNLPGLSRLWQSQWRNQTAPHVLTNYVLTVLAGTFTESGVAASLIATRQLTASAGSFIEAGNAAIFLVHRFVTASAGSFVETGQNVPLRIVRTLTASAGSFVKAGTAASLTATHKVVASAASFVVTGKTAPLVATRKFLASAGSFALTGSSASLAHGLRITASAGAFTAVGTVAGLAVRRTLAGSAGVFIETGLDAILTFGLPGVSFPGVFVVTGRSATLTPTRTMPATPGVFLATGLATPEGPLSPNVIIPEAITLASPHIEIRGIELIVT